MSSRKFFLTDASSSGFGNNYDVSSQSSNPLGIAFNDDGTIMYILDSIGIAYQYTLSTAWDVSTASYASKSLNLSGTSDSDISDIAFNSDGTIMWVCGGQNDRVYAFDLSTAWDISTGVHVGDYASVALVTSPVGLAINSAGTRMFLLDSAMDKVYQYTLSTANDITTASYDGVNVAVSPAGSIAQSIVLGGPHDNLLFVSALSGALVGTYPLNDACTLGRTDFNGEYFSLYGIDTIPAGLAFNSDGTILYVVGAQYDTVYEFLLHTAWDVSTAHYTFDPRYDGEGTAVLLPEFDYDDNTRLVEQHHRTADGTPYWYKYSTYQPFNFSALQVSSKNASLLNSWAQSRTPLSFGFVDQYPATVNSGYLTGKHLPCRKREEPFFDKWIAEVELTS